MCLVGAGQTFDPQVRATARRAVKALFHQDEELLCFPQNLVEFWNASTRPAKANGLGFSVQQAARYVDRFQTLLRLVPETPEIFPTWRSSCSITESQESRSMMPESSLR
jgi:hypothetical protein